MTTEVLAQSLTGGVDAIFGAGRMFYVKTATSALTIIATRQGTSASIRKFSNIGAGTKFLAAEGDGWTQLRVQSAGSQNIELIIGDDDVSVANAVSVTGVAIVQDLPATTITASVADTNLATASALSIPTNTSRRRITIGSLSTNTGSVRVQSAGAGANKGMELQPGTFVELRGTYAIDVRNDSGASQNIWVFEES